VEGIDIFVKMDDAQTGIRGRLFEAERKRRRKRKKKKKKKTKKKKKRRK